MHIAEAELALRSAHLARVWVALSDDPLAVEPMRLREIAVVATAIGGRIVHFS